MKTEPIERKETEVCGEIINNIDMPEMYRLAVANKATLENTIKSVMAKQGYKKVGAVLAMLESDLG
jgi:hypothetical protein